MTIDDLIKILKSKGLKTQKYGDDFSEFCGNIKNSKNQKWNVEGSIEINNNELIYSVSYCYKQKEIEMYNNFINVDKKDLNKLVDIIVMPEFEDCR
jgi:hypothetical protein